MIALATVHATHHLVGYVTRYVAARSLWAVLRPLGPVVAAVGCITAVLVGAWVLRCLLREHRR